jgi:predicted DNA binding CopG/RHH family protein
MINFHFLGFILGLGTFARRQDSTLVRVISARDMHRNERVTYDRPAVFPNLKLSTRTISLRLPEGLLNNIKVEANKRDMPYQFLIKAWLAKDVQDARQL